MGLLDQLSGTFKGALGSMTGKEGQAAIAAVLAKTNMGNLQGLVDRLQNGGLGEQVKSWLGNGANMPVSAEQIQSALNSDQLKQLAQQFGVSPDTVSELLAKYLPTAVDQASPDGSLDDSHT